ncbi:ATP-binding protein [Mycobacterium sp. MMS18-G62]
MPDRMAARPMEARAVAELLTSASSAPAALMIEGEPGIGKTTLWLFAQAQANQLGFRVLSAHASGTKSVLAYTSLGDLLTGVDPITWADLPSPQRAAIDEVLLRAPADSATDQRTVAAAFLSVIDRLTDDGPVLLAIDDMQWLDPSSAQVIAFAGRRLSGPVGFLGTARTDTDGTATTNWLQLPRPDMITRIHLRPLTVGALNSVVTECLGRSLTRPALVRIHEASGGNPFYAIELARTLDERMPEGEISLPGSLAALVRARIGALRPEVHEALLAASCLSAPTVEVIATATETNAERLVDLLEDAEEKGIVAIDGNRVRFTHPLLARGVYTDATEVRRHAMHRRLATILDEPELRARHLALASTSDDPVTLAALDEAAESALRRGAPAAAADLLKLAISLGGDTPERRIRLATCYFDAADPGPTRPLLEETIASMAPGRLRADALFTLARVRLHADGYLEAAGLLQRALDEPDVDLAQRVQMLSLLAYALFNIGQPEAGGIKAQEAVADAERLGQPDLLSQALGVRVMLGFLRGDGVDEASLRRALELEDPAKRTPMAIRPSLLNALLLDWTGQQERAYQEMRAIQRRCFEEGEEGDLILVVFYIGLNTMWRGDFVEAALIAEDAMERALQLGGDVPLFAALILRAWLDIFAGRETEARQAVTDALAASERSESRRLAEWVITGLGFLEISLGNWHEALSALQPLLASHRAVPDSTEIVAASFIPDAVEAYVELGQLDEAEKLADALQRNGRRLDRAWMLAIGARCRAMVLAARGDAEAALQTAERAMAEHDRLTMPFDRARTQLLLGRLQDRVRNRDATATLHEALTVFEQLDTPLWADRARAELARTDRRPQSPDKLTAAEQRVAELAASGMTNRGVAGLLFISPKTVEATLARVYRKLGIRSRAELGNRMGESGV